MLHLQNVSNTDQVTGYAPEPNILEQVQRMVNQFEGILEDLEAKGLFMNMTHLRLPDGQILRHELQAVHNHLQTLCTPLRELIQSENAATSLYAFQENGSTQSQNASGRLADARFTSDPQQLENLQKDIQQSLEVIRQYPCMQFAIGNELIHKIRWAMKGCLLVQSGAYIGEWLSSEPETVEILSSIQYCTYIGLAALLLVTHIDGWFDCPARRSLLTCKETLDALSQILQQSTEVYQNVRNLDMPGTYPATDRPANLLNFS